MKLQNEGLKPPCPNPWPPMHHHSCSEAADHTECLRTMNECVPISKARHRQSRVGLSTCLYLSLLLPPSLLQVSSFLQPLILCSLMMHDNRVTIKITLHTYSFSCILSLSHTHTHAHTHAHAHTQGYNQSRCRHNLDANTDWKHIEVHIQSRCRHNLDATHRIAHTKVIQMYTQYSKLNIHTHTHTHNFSPIRTMIFGQFKHPHMQDPPSVPPSSLPPPSPCPHQRYKRTFANGASARPHAPAPPPPVRLSWGLSGSQ